MTRIRTPRFPTALAQAVRIYVLAANRDEAGVTLEAELLRSGVMIPDEAIEQIEPIVNDQLIGLFIRLDDGTMFTIDREGQIHAA